MLIINFIMIRNFLRVLRRPADRESFFLAVGGFSIYVSLFINGMLKVTFGGTPDSSFTVFLALFVVSIGLQKCNERRRSGVVALFPKLRI